MGQKAPQPQGGPETGQDPRSTLHHPPLPLAQGSHLAWSLSSLGKPLLTPLTAACAASSISSGRGPPPAPRHWALPIPKVRGLSATTARPTRPWLYPGHGPPVRAPLPPPLLSGCLPVAPRNWERKQSLSRGRKLAGPSGQCGPPARNPRQAGGSARNPAARGSARGAPPPLSRACSPSLQLPLPRLPA